MAFRERDVTGYIVDGDGSPVTAAKVKFQPTALIGYTTTHIVVDRPFEATTDITGLFTISLWCDEDSLVAINYNVYFPIVNTSAADSLHVASFSLAYQDGSAINIGTLIAMGVPSPLAADLLYASIDARIADSAVKYSVAQALTAIQKLQARTNIGAGDVGTGGTVDQTIIDASANAVAGNAVFDALVLKAANNAVVHLTGNETIAGVKTFASPPLVPVGTYNYTDWINTLAEEIPSKREIANPLGDIFTELTTKADLVGGKVPAGQLPSYVDDVLEFATVAALPVTGETGKVYVITTGTDIDKQYRWSGSAYRILSFEAVGGGGGGGSIPALSNYATLAAALVAIGAAQNTLIIDVAAPITTNGTIIPENLTCLFTGGYFDISNNITLTIRGGIIASPKAHIFRGLGQAIADKSYPSETNPHWFGILDNDATDIVPAWNKLVKFFRNETGAATVSPTAAGGKVYFPEGKYYAATELLIPTRLHVTASGGNLFGKAQIRGGTNKTLFKIDSSYTDVQPQPYARDGGATIIENLFLYGTYSFVANCSATFNGLTLTAIGAGNSTLFQWKEGWQSGQVIRINDLSWQIANSPDLTNVLTLKPFRISAGRGASPNTLLVNNIPTAHASVIGATVRLYQMRDENIAQTLTLETTILSTAGQTWTLAGADFPVGGYYVEIVSMPSHTASIMLQNFHAIDMRTGTTVQNNFIRGFAGNGIYAADRYPTIAPETQPNTNNAVIRGNGVSYCTGSGIYVKGINQNNMQIWGNQCDYNEGNGIYCDSFLGSKYDRNHTSFNKQGGYLGGFNGGQSSKFADNYSEGGEPPIKLNNSYQWDGGTPGCGFDFTSSTPNVKLRNNEGYETTTGISTIKRIDTGFVRRTLGNATFPYVFDSFGHSTDSHAIAAGTGLCFHWRFANFGNINSPQIYAQLVYGSPTQGVEAATVLLEFPTSTAGAGKVGKTVLPNGFLLGKGANQQRVEYVFPRGEVSKAVDYTLTIADDGLIFNNTGAGLDVLLTLPASAGATAFRTRYGFFVLNGLSKIKIVVLAADHLIGTANGVPFDITGGAFLSGTIQYEYIEILYTGGGVWKAMSITNGWAA